MLGRDALEAQGRSFILEGRWAEARAAFELCLADSPSPLALAGMGDVCLWQDQVRLGIEYRERAFTAFRANNDPYGAAECAVNLCIIYSSMLGNLPAARGWLARAESTLEGVEPGPFAGWLTLLDAVLEDDLPATRVRVNDALAIAREAGDPDLELCALSELGVVLVQLGETAEGLRHVDEAMAGALAHEGTLLDTVIYTSCSMMHACMLVADLGRVIQWCRAADAFTSTYGNIFLYSFCRVAYGRVLLARGHWREAQEEIEAALRFTEQHYPAMHRLALAAQVELLIRRGELETARNLLLDLADPLEMAVPAATLALHDGQPSTAIAILQRWRESNLDRLSGPLHSGRGDFTLEGIAALELLVRAALATSDDATASQAATRLANIAAEGSPFAKAHAALAKARVTAHQGHPALAISCYNEALAHFGSLEMPFEIAVVRLEIARLHESTRPEFAHTELRAALTIFERLGARHELQKLSSPQPGHADGSARGPRANSQLTSREEEVLALLAEGLSNNEIAERLVISRKTASHHVSNLLAKLGLRNRTEAAAYAMRRASGVAPAPVSTAPTV